MVKFKVKGENLHKFLNAWDKEVYDLDVEVRKINLKHKNPLFSILSYELFFK